MNLQESLQALFCLFISGGLLAFAGALIPIVSEISFFSPLEILAMACNNCDIRQLVSFLSMDNTFYI